MSKKKYFTFFFYGGRLHRLSLSISYHYISLNLCWPCLWINSRQVYESGPAVTPYETNFFFLCSVLVLNSRKTPQLRVILLVHLESRVIGTHYTMIIDWTWPIMTDHNYYSGKLIGFLLAFTYASTHLLNDYASLVR